MEKEFRCRDLGLECDFVACGRDDEEIFDKAELHAEKSHGMQLSFQELYNNGSEAVREVPSCHEWDEEEMGLL